MEKIQIEYGKWQCEYCGSISSAGQTTCKHCGAKKKENENDCVYSKDTSKAYNQTSGAHKHESSSNSWIAKGLLTAISIVTIASAIFTAYVILSFASGFFTKTYRYEVSSVNWNNYIDIEKCRTEHESGWTVPSDGRITDSRTVIESYKPFLDHYEFVTKTRQVQTRKNDYKTEYYTEKEPVYTQVPVYATKYYYDIDKWKYDRTEETFGTDKDPYWSELELGDNEKEIRRYTRYSMDGIMYTGVFFKSKETKTFNLTEEEWKDIEAGQTLEITISFRDKLNGQFKYK